MLVGFLWGSPGPPKGVQKGEVAYGALMGLLKDSKRLKMLRGAPMGLLKDFERIRVLVGFLCGPLGPPNRCQKRTRMPMGLLWAS